MKCLDQTVLKDLERFVVTNMLDWDRHASLANLCLKTNSCNANDMKPFRTIFKIDALQSCRVLEVGGECDISA